MAPRVPIIRLNIWISNQINRFLHHQIQIQWTFYSNSHPNKEFDTFSQGKKLARSEQQIVIFTCSPFFSGKAYREMRGMEERVTVWYSILYVSNFGIWFFFSRSTDMRIKWQDRRIQWMFLWFTNREPMLRHQTRLFFCTV